MVELIEELADFANSISVNVLGSSDSPQTYISHLHESEMAAAGTYYKRLIKDNIVEDLTRWIAETSVDQSHSRQFACIWYLLFLFEILHDQKVSPFSSRLVQRFPAPPPNLDWRKLPFNLDFLIQPSLRYGTIQFGDQVDCFIKLVAPTEVTLLASVAGQADRSMDEIVQWIMGHSLVEHPEAGLIHFLLVLLNELHLY